VPSHLPVQTDLSLEMGVINTQSGKEQVIQGTEIMLRKIILNYPCRKPRLCYHVSW